MQHLCSPLLEGAIIIGIGVTSHALQFLGSNLVWIILIPLTSSLYRQSDTAARAARTRSQDQRRARHRSDINYYTEPHPDHATMQILTTLTTLAASYSTSTLTSTSTPLPPHDGGGTPHPFPLNTTIYYNSNTSSYPTNSTICPQNLGNSSIYAEICTPILWPAIAVAAVPDNECTITVYEDTSVCEGEARKEIFVVPAGAGCVGIQVGGGGVASGVWTCR